MEAWPASLPDIQLQFGADPDPGVLRSQYEELAQQRQRFDRETQFHSVRWMLTEFKYAVFQSFVRYKLHNGADAFTIELPFGDTDLEQVTARLVNGTYKAVFDDTFWVITATLEIEDPPIPTS